MFLVSHVIISFIKLHQSSSISLKASHTVFIMLKITGSHRFPRIRKHINSSPPDDITCYKSAHVNPHDQWQETIYFQFQRKQFLRTQMFLLCGHRLLNIFITSSNVNLSYQQQLPELWRPDRLTRLSPVVFNPPCKRYGPSSVTKTGFEFSH